MLIEKANVHPDKPITPLSRRRFIEQVAVALGTASAVMTADIANGSDAMDTEEEKVWRGMTQEELNAAYNQRDYAPNMDLVLKRAAIQSAASAERLGEPEVFSYGKTTIERLLVYRCDRRNAPIHVFVHGGAWQVGSAGIYAYIAESIVNAGGHCVLPDFASMNDDGIRLSDMARQVREAIAWVYRNASEIDGDPGQISLSGHSSGGHLAGVLLTTDWVRHHELPADIIKGGICVSGIFDLAPVRLTHRNEYLQLTDDDVAQLSPQRHVDRITAPVIVACGTEETPEFKRQSRDFAAAIQAAGKPARLLVAVGHNHFEIMETLGNPYGLLGYEILGQMGLAGS